MQIYRLPTQLIKMLIIKTSCIVILYRIVTTQHLDTDTAYQLYRTSLHISYYQLCQILLFGELLFSDVLQNSYNSIYLFNYQIVATL